MEITDRNDPRRDPETWVRFRKPLCQGCWASCCHGWPVEVSVPDLIRLGLLSSDEAAHSLRRAILRLTRTGILRRSRPEAVVFVLRQQPGGDCVFLDGRRRCTVYERRPEICRQFPRIGPRPGFCPYVPKTAAGLARKRGKR